MPLAAPTPLGFRRRPCGASCGTRLQTSSAMTPSKVATSYTTFLSSTILCAMMMALNMVLHLPWLPDAIKLSASTLQASYRFEARLSLSSSHHQIFQHCNSEQHKTFRVVAGTEGRFAAGAFDSLSAVELSNGVGSALGLDLPGAVIDNIASLLYQHSSFRSQDIEEKQQ